LLHQSKNESFGRQGNSKAEAICTVRAICCMKCTRYVLHGIFSRSCIYMVSYNIASAVQFPERLMQAAIKHCTLHGTDADAYHWSACHQHTCSMHICKSGSCCRIRTAEVCAKHMHCWRPIATGMSRNVSLTECILASSA